jgi:hypothetical protein
MAVRDLRIGTEIVECSGDHGQRDRARAGTVLRRVGEYPRWPAAITSSPMKRMMNLLVSVAVEVRPVA